MIYVKKRCLRVKKTVKYCGGASTTLLTIQLSDKFNINKHVDQII